QSCYIHTGYQQVYIVRTLIGHYRFQVHHMPHNAEFARDTHTTEYLASLTRYFQGYIAAIALSHRYLGRCSTVLVAEYTQAPVQQLAFRDLCDHFCQFLLGKLEACNRTIELYALL